MLWFTRKIHPTWLFTVACLGILAGATVARWWPGFNEFGWLVVSGGLFALAVWRSRRYMLVVATISGLLLGLWRGSLDQSQLVIYKSLYGEHVVLTGTISDDTDTDAHGQQVMRLNNLESGGRHLVGSIWVTTTDKRPLRRSDHVAIDGKLSPGFGNYAASIYSAKLIRAMRDSPGDVALDLRDNFSSHVRQSIDEPAASLGVGYLVGQKRALPDDLATALKVVGLTHVVVASGYNLTILVRLGRRLFARASKYLATATSVTLIVGFVAVTGLSPSMVRAGLVSALSLWAWYVGRKFHPLTLLSFAGALTVLVDPSYVWGNLGWELSFAAFAGVMVLAPLGQAYFFGDKKPGTVRQILGETLSAQILTAPIILLAFGRISNIAVLSNLLILPLVPLAMLLTFVAGIGGYVLPAFTHAIGWPAQELLDYMVWVVRQTAAVPWAQTELTFTWWAAIGCYLLIFAVAVYLKFATHYDLRQTNVVE